MSIGYDFEHRLTQNSFLLFSKGYLYYCEIAILPRMASPCGRTLKLEKDEYIQDYIMYASGNLINV